MFETCADAVAAYRERLPKMTELAKAMAIAKLETDGEYSEARHDAFFAEFGDNGLDADDIAAFPDYLICLRAADFRAAESDLILRAFVAGMPAKLVVQTDDLLEQSPIRDDYLIAGLRGRQLASTAIGFGASYVLQSSSASLFQLREQVLRGLAYRGPALFSVFSGANGSSLPPYLVAAAAAESRAFPAFTYDPSAGADWASRFSLHANSQADLDWPSQRLDYEDAENQLVSETVAFTLVDFAAIDPRCAKYFAKVPRAKWTADLLPVSEFLTREPKDLTEKVPCLLMVDRDNRLQKVIVNDTLVREARRCVEAWRSLQELGGIHNSHAARLVEQERKVWAEQAQAARRRRRASRRARRLPRRPQRGCRGCARCCRARRCRSGAGTVAGRGLYRDRPLHAAATSARRSTTRCSATTPTNRHPSSIRMPEPIVSLWKPRRIARSRSFTPASRAIRTSPGSMS